MHRDFDNSMRERHAHILMAVVVVLFGILAARLYMLQIAGGEQYRIQSKKNTMQPVVIQPSRGLIRDRNGAILVDNSPSYAISVIPPRLLSNIEDGACNGLLKRLGQIVALPCEAIAKKLKSRHLHFYDPVKLKHDVDFETVSVVEENRYDLPGVEIQIEARRGYPIVDPPPQQAGTPSKPFPMAPHILGYVGLISPSRYAQLKPLGYRYDDQIGKRGIERLFEDRMRGQEGVKYIEVNAKGREVGNFPGQTSPAIPGDDVALTLDSRVQRVAEYAFADSMRGSLVAMNPQTGEILAMVSKPSFHPRSIRDPKAWHRLQTDSALPLLNRSLQGEYPPASVFKMIAAIAALDMGLLQAGDHRFRPCRGGMVFGNRRFGCHDKKGCGNIDLREALARSCDVFFYQLGMEMGIENWHRYAHMFGFGEATNIDIAPAGEARGLLPDRTYYERRRGAWTRGYMLNLIIGQGELLATPIQVARYVSALATGRLPKPYVIKGTQSQTAPLFISESALKTVQSMMWEVVNGPSGTGKRAQLPDIAVAGKTGTAQNPHGEDHAWFVAFAPVENPRIAVAIMVENGGSGGAIAAPIAQKTLAAYFEYADSRPSGEWVVDDQKAPKRE